MDVLQIIGKLEALGVTLSLAVDYECSEITPEIKALLQELSKNRETVIDALAGQRYIPLPDNTPIPAAFRSDRLNQIHAIFAVCYRMLELYEGAGTEEQWKSVYAYHEGKLDDTDTLAVELHTVCVSELIRQYRREKLESQNG